MSKNHTITTFSKLHEASAYYLEQSFVQLEECFRTELAGFIVSLELDKIYPTKEDQEIVNNTNLIGNPVELLQSEIPDVLSEETLLKMAAAWEVARIRSRTECHKFSKSYKIVAIEILGHINMFGFFIETLVNRHLLYLKFAEKMDEFSYSRFANARTMERLLFMFKDEVGNQKLHLNEISLLFSLRNKTVHYTPDNANALQPDLSELLRIWKQAVKLIKAMEKSEQFQDEKFSDLLIERVQYFENHWIK